MRKVHLMVLTFFLICATGVIFAPVVLKDNKNHTDQAKQVIITPTPTPKPQYEYHKSNRIVNYHCNWFVPYYLDNISIPHTEIKLTSIGYHFITAYCPAECGYNGSNYPTGWRTASGTICHRAAYENRYTEPTTCAIDRKIYSFSTEFFIPAFDRVFISEDTGAFGGYWLDLFYEYYSDVQSFPTGYYEVFAVEYEYSHLPVSYYKQLQRDNLGWRLYQC